MRRGAVRLIGMLLLLFVQTVLAQVRQPRQPKLRDPGRRAAAVAELGRGDTARRRRTAAWARTRGVPLRVDDGVCVMELYDIVDGRPLYRTTCNVNAAISTAADLVRQTGPYNVDGGAVTAGVWDAGSVLSTHQEFGGRVTVKDGASSHYHATHVGGTIGATGVTASARGMAPATRIDTYNWTSDLTEMTGRAASHAGESGKLYLSNHSYGYVAGWVYMSASSSWSGKSGYHWSKYTDWGDTTARDPIFGQYYYATADWDELCYDAPYYLPFKSAGNDRNDNPGNGATVYYTIDGGSTWSNTAYNSASHPPGDGKQYYNGYDTILPVSTAKNIVTVGAANDAVSGGSRSPGNATMASFSSWGPTDDGRIKPDIVANGVSLHSSHNASATAYAYLSGTSMSCPNACGSAALLVEYFGDLFPGRAMRASTLKGLILHTADDRGVAGPDFAYGWGLMNTKGAADMITSHYHETNAHVMVEGRLHAGNTNDTFVFTWNATHSIRATLCWTDPPGTGTVDLNDTTSRLVNDLDLRVIGPGGAPTHLPYILDRANPSSAATSGDNVVDNVEQVLIAAPSTGDYTVTVSHKESLTDGEQHYSLWLSGQVLGPTNVTLTVVSGRGGASPAAGIHTNVWGEVVTCAVTNSPNGETDTESTRVYVCTGWTGTGSMPVSGISTNTGAITLTSDSTLTWNWALYDLALSNQVVTATETNSVLNRITAGNGYRIDPGGNVTFEGGKTVRLLPGFHAVTGGTMRARTDP